MNYMCDLDPFSKVLSQIAIVNSEMLPNSTSGYISILQNFPGEICPQIPVALACFAC